MADPITVSLLVNLAVQEFVKSGTGDLAKRFTAEAIAKIPVLWDRIKTRLTGRSARVDEALAKLESGDQSAIATVTKNLDVVLDEDTDFAEALTVLVREIQAGEIRQVGLEDFEAGELEAEIDQTTPANPNASVEQTGAKGVKVKGKAVLKIIQK